MPNLVFHSGPADANILIVGEAPGPDEARLGEPFVGRAGKLTTHALAKGGILRSYCRFTNVIKEVPPHTEKKKYDASTFINLDRKRPVLSPAGLNYYNGFLEELKELNPNLIIAFGNTALWALTGKRGITKWRGSILDSPYGKVLPVIHPAAALRQYGYRYTIFWDLIKAGNEYEFPEIRRKEVNYILHPSMPQIKAYLDECRTVPKRNSSPVAFDIEGPPSREVLMISFSHSPGSAICIPFVHKNRESYFTPPQEAQVWKWIGEFMEDPKVEKVAHNAVYDWTYIFRYHNIFIKGFLHDTMIMQGMLYADLPKDVKPKSLAFGASIMTDLPYYKEDRIWSSTDETGWIYNCKDSDALSRMFPQLKEQLEGLDSYKVYLEQAKLIEPLIFMNDTGLKISQENIKEAQQKAEEEIVRLTKEFQMEIGDPNFNPDSAHQVMEYFYDRLGVKEIMRKRQNGSKTRSGDEKALKQLAKNHPEASKILAIRGFSKLKGTYLDVNLDPRDGRLRSSMNPIGTWTLRLSSSEDLEEIGTNIQNLPPQMRANIIPDKGRWGASIDYSQAELYVFAYTAPEPKLIACFEEGRDAHSELAVEIAKAFKVNLTPQDIKELDGLHKKYPEDPKHCAPIGQGTKSWRAWGKEGNYALNYGMHWKSAALRWECPEAQAKVIWHVKHALHPGIKTYWNWIEAALEKEGILSNLFGFNRRFLGRWEEMKKKGYDFPAQSTVACAINQWGVNYVYYRQDLFYDVTLLNQVHDSVWIQSPASAERAAKILNLITTNLEQPLTFRGRSFTIPAEVTLHPENFRDGIELGTGPFKAEQLEEHLCQLLKEQGTGILI